MLHLAASFCVRRSGTSHPFQGVVAPRLKKFASAKISLSLYGAMGLSRFVAVGAVIAHGSAHAVLIGRDRIGRTKPGSQMRLARGASDDYRQDG